MNPGSRLKERYLIERELGRGGIGVVYLARDERLHSMPVVIKFLLDSSGQHAWLTQKFLQEAEALTRINHPGVVRVIDRDRAEDGRPFFVMEFIQGRPLREAMTPDGMDFEYAAHLLRQLGQALHAAHQQGVFHRDLKPENILLQTLSEGDEQVKLIDFGIAKVKNSQAAQTTDVSLFAGSLQYTSPEQLASQPVSAATDIYSLAIIAYEMVTGRRPFNADAPSPLAAMRQLAQMQQSQEIVPPKHLRPSLSGAAQSVILQALSYDPNKRPQNARAFTEELSSALLAPDANATAPGLSPATQQATRETGDLEQQAAATVPGASPPKESSEPKKPWWLEIRFGKLAIQITLVSSAVLVAAVALSVFMHRTSEMKSNTGGVAVAPTSLPERQFAYSVTVQKDPKRYPGSQPFQIPGEVIFSPGDRVRFTFSSPQTGFLYIINESPEVKGQAPGFNVLFPSQTSNEASAQLIAGRQVSIPERGVGFVFDKEEGAEKLWVVWAVNKVDELEALKRFANPQDKGEIKDAGLVATLRNFLTRHASDATEAQKDEETKQTTVKGKGEILVRLVKLEHH